MNNNYMMRLYVFRAKFYESLKGVEKTQNFILKTVSELKERFPFLKNSDIRISSLNTILQHSRTLIVTSKFIENIDESDFSKVKEEDIQQAERFVRFHYFLGVFSSFENCVRIIMRHIKKDDYYKNNNSNLVNFIHKVYKMKDLPVPDVFDFSRTIRNCIHNNGFYFPEKKRNKSLKYRQREYVLEIGEPIDFLTWEIIFFVVEDIVKLLSEIFKSDLILHEKFIQNPVALYEQID